MFKRSILRVRSGVKLLIIKTQIRFYSAQLNTFLAEVASGSTVLSHVALNLIASVLETSAIVPLVNTRG